MLPAFACSRRLSAPAFVCSRVSHASLLSVPAFACSRRLRAPHLSASGFRVLCSCLFRRLRAPGVCVLRICRLPGFACSALVCSGVCLFRCLRAPAFACSGVCRLPLFAGARLAHAPSPPRPLRKTESGAPLSVSGLSLPHGCAEVCRGCQSPSAKEWITTPERSLGSNHVVFGGMMLPVSAMLMSCCIETG